MAFTTLRRLEPETYIHKAEEDIRNIQLACSLAEPPWDGALAVHRCPRLQHLLGWDAEAAMNPVIPKLASLLAAGYCGLVQVSEEDIPEEVNGSPSRGSELSAATQPTGPSSSARRDPPASTPLTPPGSISSPQKAPSEQEVVQRILQQIRDIANTPLEQRHTRLSRLAKDAVTAAAESSPQTATQLLRLAQHACPEGDVQLTAQIRASLEQAFRITSEPASPPGESVDQSTAERISGANDRVPDAEAASKQLPTADVALSRDSGESHAISKQPQNAAAAANRHFVAAKDLIKRGLLTAALSELDAAHEKCPADRIEAKRQIARHRSAVQAAINKGSRSTSR